VPVEQRRAVVRALVRHAKLVGAARPRRKRLPRQQYPRQIEGAYARALSSLVEPMIRRAYAPLLQALPGIMRRSLAARHLDGWGIATRVDAGEGKEVRDLVDAARDRLTSALDNGAIEDLARKFAAQTSTYQRIQLGRQTEAALGVNVLTTDRAVNQIAGQFVDSNVALIKGLSDKVAADVQSIVFRGIQDGKLHPDIAKDLESRFKFGASRSQLIARDQVGKLYGQVNAARQRELGVAKFIWNTVGDDRVRDEHAERDGQEYSYDDPPDGELPGEPVMCRCWAEPVFDGLDENEDADDADESDDEDEDEDQGGGGDDGDDDAPVASFAEASGADVGVAESDLDVDGGDSESGLFGGGDEAVLDDLQQSAIESAEPLGEGDNGAQLAHLESGADAVVKRAADEVAVDDAVPAGTYYKREKAAYDVSRLLGVDQVPPTTTRVVGGSPASVQQFVARPTVEGQLDREASEKMRALDFVLGNGDRPSNYLKVAGAGGRTVPVLIDNGLSFPIGPAHGFAQVAADIPDARGVLPQVQAMVAQLDLRALAKTLLRDGIEPEAVEHTLYRARYLQLNPEALALDGRKKTNIAWSTEALEAGQRIGDHEVRAVNALVAELSP
jgi:SPP1 gp7 family putative phage head morphogenesis protein